MRVVRDPSRGRFYEASRHIAKGEVLLTEHAALHALDTPLNVHTCRKCGAYHRYSPKSLPADKEENDERKTSNESSSKMSDDETSQIETGELELLLQSEQHVPCEDACAPFLEVMKDFDGFLKIIPDIHEQCEIDVSHLKMTMQYFELQKEGKLSIFDTLSFAPPDERIRRASSMLAESLKNTPRLGATPELIAKVLSTFRTNTHETRVVFGETPLQGSALFPRGSLFNHACRENSFFQTVPGAAAAASPDSSNGSKNDFLPTLVVRALTDIPEGEAVTLNYLQSRYLSTQHRRALLRKSYNFTCECNLCASSSELCRGFECTHCENGVVYAPPPSSSSAEGNPLDAAQPFSSTTLATAEGSAAQEPSRKKQRVSNDFSPWKCMICDHTFSNDEQKGCLDLEENYEFGKDAHPFEQGMFLFDTEFPKSVKFHESHHLLWRALDERLPPRGSHEDLAAFVRADGRTTADLARAYMYLTRCLDELMLRIYGVRHPILLRYWHTMARICQNRNVKRFDLAELAYERAMQTAESVFHRSSPAAAPKDDESKEEASAKAQSKKRKNVDGAKGDTELCEEPTTTTLSVGDQYSDIYRQLERERLVVQMMGKRMEEEEDEADEN